MLMRLAHLAALCLVLAVAPSAVAQTDTDLISSEELEKALKKPATRGIRVEKKARVDLRIPFELNSSDLKPEAERQLLELQAALRMDTLLDSRFEIIGHTDASGSAAYNRWLSQARAESVKRFLVDRGIDPERLDIIGRGEDDLLYPDRPLHGANRRVEIKNLGEL